MVICKGSGKSFRIQIECSLDNITFHWSKFIHVSPPSITVKLGSFESCYALGSNQLLNSNHFECDFDKDWPLLKCVCWSVLRILRRLNFKPSHKWLCEINFVWISIKIDTNYYLRNTENGHDFMDVFKFASILSKLLFLLNWT